MGIFERMPPREVYSEEYKKELLNHLRCVGEKKPVGYLPKATLVDVCGVKPEEMKRELEAKGLIVLDLAPEETGVESGAFYVYDKEVLGRILQLGKETLVKNGWPTEPDAFVRHLKVFAKDPALYRLVMQVFADPRLQKEQEPI